MALAIKHVGMYACIAIIALLVFIAVFASYIAPYDPSKADLSKRLIGPCIEHPFGTDQLGRDISSRVIFGTRISLGVGAIVVVSSALIGVVIGTISGYFGGIIDEVIMRVIDTFMAFPNILLALGIVGLFGSGLINMTIALIVVDWTQFARLTRASVLSIRQRGFVKASIGLGGGNAYVMVRHIIPNTLSPLIVMSTIVFGYAVLAAAGLSFLGLGVQPPTPEWGYMLNDGKLYMKTAPYIMIFPGIMIMITVITFNYLGDGLRDILDPRKNREIL